MSSGVADQLLMVTFALLFGGVFVVDDESISIRAWPSRLDMISFLHRHRRFHSLTCLSMRDVITDLVQTEAKRSRTGVVARLLLQITICSQTTAESATTVSSIDPRPINSCLNWWKFIISHAHFIQERES